MDMNYHISKPEAIEMRIYRHDRRLANGPKEPFYGKSDMWRRTLAVCGTAFVTKSRRNGREHQRREDKPAQGNALGPAREKIPALKGRHNLGRPFRAQPILARIPRALP